MVPVVEITTEYEKDGQDYHEWLASVDFSAPPKGAKWFLVIPAFSADTTMRFRVNGKDGSGTELFVEQSAAVKTVKNQNIANIALNLGEIKELYRTRRKMDDS